MRRMLMLGVLTMTFAAAALADDVWVTGEVREIGLTDIVVDTSTGNQKVEVGPMSELYRFGVTLKMRDYVKIKGHTMPSSDVVVADSIWVRGRTVRNLTAAHMMGSGHETMSGRSAANAALMDEVSVIGEIRDIGVNDILVDTSTGNQRVEVGSMDQLYRQGVTLKMRDFVKIKGHKSSESDVIIADRLWVRGTTVRNLIHSRSGSDAMSGRSAANAAMMDEVSVIGEIRDIGVNDILVDTPTGNQRVEVGPMDELYKHGVTLKMRDFVKIKGYKSSESDVVIADRLWVRGRTMRNLYQGQHESGNGG